MTFAAAVSALLAISPAAFADEDPPSDPPPPPAEPVFVPELVPPVESPPVVLPPSTIPQGTFDPPVSYPNPISTPMPYGTLPDGTPVYQAVPPGGWVPGAPMQPIPAVINDFVASHPNSSGWMVITMPDGRIAVRSADDPTGVWNLLDSASGTTAPTSTTGTTPTGSDASGILAGVTFGLFVGMSLVSE